MMLKIYEIGVGNESDHFFMGVGHGETDGVEESVNEVFVEKLE